VVLVSQQLRRSNESLSSPPALLRREDFLLGCLFGASLGNRAEGK
jgi:hypothetical protein